MTREFKLTLRNFFSPDMDSNYVVSFPPPAKEIREIFCVYFFSYLST